MIEKEQIKKLNREFQKNKQVSTKTIKSLGVNEATLRKLLNEKYLLRVSRGVYTEGLNWSTLEDNQQSEEISWEDFKELLKIGKYQSAAEQISKVKYSLEEESTFHLYGVLLMRFKDLNGSQRELFKKARIEDYKASGSMNSIDNKIRLTISKQDYSLAKRQLVNKYEKDITLMNEEDRITYELLEEINKKEQQDEKIIRLLKKNKKYAELEIFLLEKKERGTLKQKEEETLLEISKRMISKKNTQNEQLRAYLKENGWLQYNKLLQNLMKLSILEGDTLYKKVYEVIRKIEEGTYEYSLLPYLLGFSNTVEEHPEQAEIYLELLKIGEQENHKCYLIEELKKQLKKSKNRR